MYSEETIENINEFFRLMTITMADLKATVMLGKSYQKKAIEMENQETIDDIQKDIVKLQELIGNAKKYSDHIEKLFNDCVPEHILINNISNLLFLIRGDLIGSIMEIEKQLKGMGFSLLHIKR